jgi:membrane protein implicated in regulation of membrane protease activity
MDEGQDMDLGGGFWLKFIGAAIGCAIAAVLVLLLVGAAWARWGFFVMFLLLGAVLLGIGWIFDRRERKRRDSLA